MTAGSVNSPTQKGTLVLFDVVDRSLVALQPVDLTTQGEREELEWQLARSSEAVAGLDLIPLRRAGPGEYGLGGGVVAITSERELDAAVGR